jgi:hypothetical protein
MKPALFYEIREAALRCLAAWRQHVLCISNIAQVLSIMKIVYA